MAASTTILALVPLLFNRRFYFYDDTQAAGWGIWYHVGMRLRTGDLSYLNLHTWPAGNLWAEGQWGFLNPFTTAMGLGSTYVGDLGLYSTLVKVAFLVFCAIGAYLLASAVGAGRTIAVLVGILAPMGGFTVYMDTSSWFSGLMAWGWSIWLWLALVHMQHRRWGLLPAAGFVFLIVTIGYAHGTIMAGLLIASFALNNLVARDWRAAARFVALGLFAVAVSLPVLLPGVRTAPVTLRNDSGVGNTGFFGPDLSDSALAATLTGGFDLPNYAGGVSWLPLMYIAWALPLMWSGWRSRSHDRRDLGPAFTFGILVALFMFGPTELGPLRYPTRVQPYLALTVLIVSVAAATTARPRLEPSLRTAARLLALPLIGTWLVLGDTPLNWRADLTGLALVGLGLALTWWTYVRGLEGRWILVVAISVTLAATLFQRWYMPSPALADWGLPTQVALLQKPLSGTVGDTLVLGSRDGSDLPAMWDESSLANAWLVSPQTVQNGYQVIGFRGYTELLGTDNLGLNGPHALDALFTDVPTTDVAWVDAFGISNLQIWRSTYPDRDLLSPPDGWRVAQEGATSVLWSRTGGSTPAEVGGVVYASPGVEWVATDVTSDEAVLEVRNSGPTPGRLVLSRLAWPGYSISGQATLADPTADMLLTIDVPADRDWTAVTVRFVPPGLRAGLLALALALLGLVLLELSRRRRRPQVAPDGSPALPTIEDKGTG